MAIQLACEGIKIWRAGQPESMYLWRHSCSWNSCKDPIDWLWQNYCNNDEWKAINKNIGVPVEFKKVGRFNWSSPNLTSRYEHTLHDIIKSPSTHSYPLKACCSPLRSTRSNKIDVEDFFHDGFSSISHNACSACHILVLIVLQTRSYVWHVESPFGKAAKCNQYCALELVFIPEVSSYLWSLWCIALVKIAFSNVDLPTVSQTSLFA